jgi:hypothetical protein
MSMEEREEPPSIMGFLVSQRMGNILRGIISMLLLLGVFLVGFDAAHYTNEQVKEYCIAYNNMTCFNCMVGNGYENLTRMNMTDKVSYFNDTGSIV